MNKLWKALRSMECSQVLFTLAETDREFTYRDIAKRTGIWTANLRRVCKQLENLDVVRRREVGPHKIAYWQLNHKNAVVPGMVQFFMAVRDYERRALVKEIAEEQKE